MTYAVRDATVTLGGATVLRDVSLDVGTGQRRGRRRR